MSLRSSGFTGGVPGLAVEKRELLGAHVSTAGGVASAPARGAEIGASAIQIFTKVPNRWHDPVLDPEHIDRFRNELARCNIKAVVVHDSYLINLASPDASQSKRSMEAFKMELSRCRDLAVELLVTHPGNYMDDRAEGLERNAAAYGECLAAVNGPSILLETTAGTGTALGSTFEELAELRQRIPSPFQSRVGFCADTCHLYSAGYDLVDDWSGVWEEWDRHIGLDLLKCIHLNDSKTPFASRRDRHECIAEGTLGAKPFRQVMQDDRFRGIIKIIETPKGDDKIGTDRRMLRRLRSYGKRNRKRMTR